MNINDFEQEVHRLSELIDQGIRELVRQAREHAFAEADYRKAYAMAFLGAAAKTVRERELMADAQTDEDRRKAYLSRGMENAAKEAVRARRAQLSAFQSLMNAHRAEAEFVRTSPNG